MQNGREQWSARFQLGESTVIRIVSLYTWRTRAKEACLRGHTALMTISEETRYGQNCFSNAKELLFRRYWWYKSRLRKPIIAAGQLIFKANCASERLTMKLQANFVKMKSVFYSELKEHNKKLMFCRRQLPIRYISEPVTGAVQSHLISGEAEKASEDPRPSMVQ